MNILTARVRNQTLLNKSKSELSLYAGKVMVEGLPELKYFLEYFYIC